MENSDFSCKRRQISWSVEWKMAS